MLISRTYLVLPICSASVVVLAGCQENEEIRRYSVEKQGVEKMAPPDNALIIPTPGKPTDRLLAAIVPRGEQTWFFKVTGRADALDKETETFRTFVRSLRFAEGQGGHPTWTLPEGWRAIPASGMRFATLQFGPKEEPFELTVIPLPSPQDDQNAYILSNINRWRGQLSRPPIGQQQMAEQSEQFDLDDATATIVSILGNLKQDNMTRPPFASSRPFAASPAAKPDPIRPKTGELSPIIFSKPEGWVEGEVGGMRKAAFKVTDGEKTVEITVIDLAGAAGDRLSNINRWREQIQLDTITQEQLDRDMKSIEVGDGTGDYVELVGPEDAQPQESILGVITIHSGRAWFIKLKGAAGLAENEKQRFESFVKSVKFTPSSGSL